MSPTSKIINNYCIYYNCARFRDCPIALVVIEIPVMKKLILGHETDAYNMSHIARVIGKVDSQRAAISEIIALVKI